VVQPATPPIPIRTGEKQHGAQGELPLKQAPTRRSSDLAQVPDIPNPFRNSEVARESQGRYRTGDDAAPVRRLSAFSLAELVIVVVIVGIMAGLAVPRYAEAIARQRVDAAARRLTIDISLTQHRAKSRSASHRLRFLEDTSQYTIEDTTDGSTWQAIPDIDRPQQGYSVDLALDPYGTTVQTVSCGADRSIVFDGYGAPTQVGSISLGVGRYTKVITIDAEEGDVIFTTPAAPSPSPSPIPTPGPTTLPGPEIPGGKDLGGKIGDGAGGGAIK